MTDEEFFAWLDGELEDADAERVAAAVAADPALQARADAHRALTIGLRGVFQPVADAAPAPPSFGAEVVSLPLHKAANENGRGRFGFAQWGAMAASLALGLALSPMLFNRPTGPVSANGAVLTASGELDHALDTQLASIQGEPTVRIGVTFKNKDGEICRSFGGRFGSGLACRDGQDWRLLGIYGPESGAATDYRMAAGNDPRLAEYIDAMISGEPFDAAAEAASKDRGWR